MFCEVIGHICRSFSPEELELFLFNTVSNLIKSHAKGFRKFLAHGRVEDTCGSGVIVEYWCALGWLRVAEFDEGNSHGASLLGGEEDTTGFSFCSRADHILVGVAEDM